jgi:fructokinase
LRILSIGEILWDVFGEREFLGGAPLNFSVSAQRLGNSVALLSAVGADSRGSLAHEAMRQHGLTTDFVQTSPTAPTGAAIVSTDTQGNASFVIDRPAAFDKVDLNTSLLSWISAFQPQWIYFGTLAQVFHGGEQRLAHILNTLPKSRRFYDINLRHGHWTLPLVKQLSGLATIIKMNESEAQELWHQTNGHGVYSLDDFCSFWAAAYGCELICITRGSEGCAVWQPDHLQFFPGFRVSVVDTVGAGDAFAAAFLHGLEQEWLVEKTANFANRIGGFVASRAGATPDWSLEEFPDFSDKAEI